MAGNAATNVFFPRPNDLHRYRLTHSRFYRLNGVIRSFTRAAPEAATHERSVDGDVLLGDSRNREITSWSLDWYWVPLQIVQVSPSICAMQFMGSKVACASSGISYVASTTLPLVSAALSAPMASPISSASKPGVSAKAR